MNTFNLRHLGRTLVSLNTKTNFLREYWNFLRKCFIKIHVVWYLYMHKTSNSSKYKIQYFLDGHLRKMWLFAAYGLQTLQPCALLKKSVFYKIINFSQIVNPTKNMTLFLYNSIFLKTTFTIWTSIVFVEIWLFLHLKKSSSQRLVER